MHSHSTAPRTTVRSGTARGVATPAILDNVFPARFSGFRLAEYTFLLARLPAAEVWTSGSLVGCAGTGGSLEGELSAFRSAHPELAERVRVRTPAFEGDAAFAYTIFLNQAHEHLPYLEARNIGFAFTLYPGGGFAFDQPRSDRMLRDVCDSPCFRRMLVTQHVTREYVERRRFCPPEKITFLAGGASGFDPARPLPQRSLFGRDKDTLDICFAAHKYEPRGISKGYDLFVEIAARVAKRFPQVRFHVVGGFSAQEVNVGELADRIRFHGALPCDRLAEFFAGMDAIVSPNVPFVLGPGAFDGFPTGTCVEAGLAGAAVFCTDSLNENRGLLAGEEFVPIPYHAAAAAYLLGAWLERPERLRALGERGQAALARQYGPQAQLEPRLEFLRKCLSESG